jgi:hypothetical protein
MASGETKLKYYSICTLFAVNEYNERVRIEKTVRENRDCPGAAVLVSGDSLL